MNLEIVNNIKQEPEAHFVLVLLSELTPKPILEPINKFETKEFVVNLEKFDSGMKRVPKMFDSLFVCGKCHYLTNHPGNMRKHELACKGKKSLRCFLCDQSFSYRFEKASHEMAIHRAGPLWKCIECPYTTLKRKLLYCHNQTHSKPFSCTTCDKIYPTRGRLNTHQEQHRHGDFESHAAMKFDCNECNKFYKTKSGLLVHKRAIHRAAAFQCDICAKSFKTKNAIKLHLETHFKTPCGVCQKMLARFNLRNHMEEDHPELQLGRKLLQCDICVKKFASKSRLLNHIYTHLRIVCSVCGRVIKKKAEHDHMTRFHRSGSSLLACNIIGCQQKYRSVEDLTAHLIIHLGPGLYQCPNCNYSAKTLRIVTGHMSRHH